MLSRKYNSRKWLTVVVKDTSDAWPVMTMRSFVHDLYPISVPRKDLLKIFYNILKIYFLYILSNVIVTGSSSRLILWISERTHVTFLVLFTMDIFWKTFFRFRSTVFWCLICPVLSTMIIIVYLLSWYVYYMICCTHYEVNISEF